MSNELAFYSPDTDPTLAGTLTNVTSLVPSFKGYKGAPSGVATQLAALAGTCQGAANLINLSGVSRFFAGTATKLYEAGSTTWTDVSRAAAYGLASDARWCFAQYGNVSLAVNKADLIQSSTAGAFADVAGSPKAACIDVCNNFVFVGNTNDGSFGDSPDRIWWSALGDYTSWTPSITTQAGSTRLTSSYGPITAVKRFGSYIIAYKAESMYMGVYQGAPDLWLFNDIPGNIGTPAHSTVVNIGTPEDPKHIFMGKNDFYVFDGSRPVPIGSPLRETVFNEVNQALINTSYALHDALNSRVYFYYPTGGASSPNKCVVYQYKVNKWGRDDQQIEVAAEFVQLALTYGGFGTLYSTYVDAPSVSYGSSLFLNSTGQPAIFKTDHKLYTLNGASVSSDLTTGDYGNNTSFTLLRRLKPQFITAPSAASMTNYYRNSLGDLIQLDTTTAMSNSRFDVLRSARWHRATLTFAGDVELNSISADFTESGLE